MDRITEGFLTEFSNEFGVASMPEKDRFERFCGWLAVRRHYSESTFEPDDLMTGAGGDTGIDAIAIIVNNNLVTDVDAVARGFALRSRAALGIDPAGMTTGLPGVWLSLAVERVQDS
jgi:hypothetical protein